MLHALLRPVREAVADQERSLVYLQGDPMPAENEGFGLASSLRTISSNGRLEGAPMLIASSPGRIIFEAWLRLSSWANWQNPPRSES